MEKYLTGITIDEFLNHSEKRYAAIRQIKIKGEACNRISSDLKLAHSEVEWAEINGFRNISIHEYFGVNFQIVGEIAQNDLPNLKHQFKKIFLEISC